MKKKTRFKFTKEILENEIKEGLCRQDIAKKYNCSHIMVTRYIKKFELKIKNKTTGGRNLKDLKGFKIGSIEVLERGDDYIQDDGKHIVTWKCICACGTKFTSRGSDIRQRKVKTCGCRISIKSKRCWRGCGEVSKSVWSSIVSGAEYREIPFEITIEDVWGLFLKQNRRCSLSGIELKLLPLKEKTASLDRIDSSKGYTLDNIQWVHKDINKIKQNLEEKYFIELCKKVASYNK